jgi:hypothetical protein
MTIARGAVFYTKSYYYTILIWVIRMVFSKSTIGIPITYYQKSYSSITLLNWYYK